MEWIAVDPTTAVAVGPIAAAVAAAGSTAVGTVAANTAAVVGHS